MAARQLLNVPQYAAHRKRLGLAGATPQAVEAAIKSGRLTPFYNEKGRVRIDPEVADIQWATKTDPVKSAAVNGDKPLGPPPPDDPRAPVNTGREEGGSEFWRAKTRREIADANRAEIEARKAAGDLVLRAPIENMARRCARAARDAVMGVPERTAQQLGLTPDQEQVLATALRVALDDASRTIEAEIRAVLPNPQAATA